eukprot:COSAG01_NODE_54938_length_328_cov_4.026201_1_plen_40_part_10
MFNVAPRPDLSTFLSVWLAAESDFGVSDRRTPDPDLSTFL